MLCVAGRSGSSKGPAAVGAVPFIGLSSSKVSVACPTTELGRVCPIVVYIERLVAVKANALNHNWLTLGREAEIFRRHVVAGKSGEEAFKDKSVF